MKKILIILSLITALGMLSCQSNRTKKILCGTWAYTGGTYATVTFTENNTFYTGGLLGSNGRYEIDGKKIIIYYSHGTSTTLKLIDDNNLYASDGSHYIKTSD